MHVPHHSPTNNKIVEYDAMLYYSSRVSSLNIRSTKLSGGSPSAHVYSSLMRFCFVDLLAFKKSPAI